MATAPDAPADALHLAVTTHTEPFHISKAIATLDYVSVGRAGSGCRSAGALTRRRTWDGGRFHR